MHTDHATSDGELWAVPIPVEKRRRDFVHNTMDAPFPPVPASAHILNDRAEHVTGWCPNCRADSTGDHQARCVDCGTDLNFDADPADDFKWQEAS